jgi:hypothetical protein
MAWIESEVGRANRNLLIVNGILGLAAGYGIFSITQTTIHN